MSDRSHSSGALRELTVAAVEVFPVRLPTLRSFAVAGGAVASVGEPSVRVLVRVEASDGSFGWGEATPIPAWTYETTESVTSTIRRYLSPATVGFPAWDLDGLHRRFDRAINRGLSIGMPLAKGAVDMALWDLLGRRAGESIGVLWGQRRSERIQLCWIVAGQTEGQVTEAVAEGRGLGYEAFKVKVGLHDHAADVAVVSAVCRAAPGAAVWVDGNQGYTLDGALRMARALAPLGVTCFEQPLPSNDLDGFRRLRQSSPLPVALDESLRHPSDLATFVKLGAIDIAVAKVQRNAGLTLSRRLLQAAEDAGLGLMGSGLTDSDLGLAASLHLFSAFGIDTPVDLNGRQFVDSAYATGATVKVSEGWAAVPTGPGLGVDVDLDVVRDLAFDPFA